MPPASRIIAIGDVHGCGAALAVLLEALQLRRNDTVVTLGDAVDRGPDSRGVIEQLLALGDRCRAVFVLGNHEQMLLDAFAGRIPPREWLIHGGAQTLASYGVEDVAALAPAHLEFLRSWVDFYESPGHFFVHANYFAGRPLASQPWDELRWTPLNLQFPRPHLSGKRAIVGHTSQKSGEVLNLGHLVCIDTFCCGGQWLTAYDVTGDRLLQANQSGEVRTLGLPAVASSVPPRPPKPAEQIDRVEPT